MKRKLLSVILAIAAVLSIFSVAALAEPAPGQAYLMAYTRPLGTTGTNTQYMGFYDESVHFAYTTDGTNWTALNDNKGVVFYKHSAGSTNHAAKQVKDPFIFQKEDGTYVMLATANTYNSSLTYTSSGITYFVDRAIIYWDSTDLINWENQKLITLSPLSNRELEDRTYPTVPQAFYNGATKDYTIVWKDLESGRIYSNTIDSDFTTPSEPLPYEGSGYPAALDMTPNAPEGAIVGSIIPVSDEELKVVTDRLGTPVVPVGTEDLDKVYLEAGQKLDISALPQTGTTVYSDGSATSGNLLWDKADIPDLSEPGTYEITVPIEGQPDYVNPYNENGADPDIFRGPDGLYYYTSSYMFPEYNQQGAYQYDRIAIRCAETVAGLATAEERVVFWRQASGPASYHIWAPEIRYVDFDLDGPEEGVWVIYFAGGKTTSNYDLHVYAITCSGDPMTDAWGSGKDGVATGGDMVEMAGLGGLNSEGATRGSFDLDATVFEHAGEWYMIWASKPSTSNLVISKMTSPTSVKDPVGGTATICRPEYTWERRRDLVTEAPTIMKYNGRIYLGYAAGSTDATYCLGGMYIDEEADLLDPDNWTKIPYPLMTSNLENSQFGPGHATYTVAEDGVTPLLSYYARPKEQYSGVNGFNPLYQADRWARIAVIYFTEDDMPYYGIPPMDGYLTGATATLEVEVVEKMPNVLWYSFDGDSGSTIQDVSGNGNDGTLSGSSYSFAKDDVRGQYLRLNRDPNGSSGYAQLPNGILGDAADWTIATWVNMSAYRTWQRLFDFGNSNTAGYMFLSLSNGSSASASMTFGITPRTNSSEQTLTITPTPMQTDKWTHVAITQSGETVSIYLDGVLAASKSGFTYNPSNCLGTGTTQNYIGRSQWSGDSYIRAYYDDFRIYDYALTGDQIVNMAEPYLPEISAVGQELFTVNTTMGVVPTLPDKVDVTYADDTTGTAAISWDPITVEQTYAAESFTVNGKVPGYSGTLQAVVTVRSLSIRDGFLITADVHLESDLPAVTYVVSNNTQTDTDVYLMYGAYNAKGVMRTGGSNVVTVPAGSYIERTYTVALPQDLTMDEAVMKAYVWDSYFAPMMNSEAALNDIIDEFEIPNMDDIRGNITLPKTVNGAQVKWSSDNEEIISTQEVQNGNYDPTPAGVVNRDPDEDKTVTLTATFTLNDTARTKAYAVTVKKAAGEVVTTDYLLAGFANGPNYYDKQGTSEDIQQIYFSLSEDGNYYSDMLNGYQPVVTSSMGTKGLRDPHIIRSPEGDKFYMIATDLDARGGNWGQYSTAGSLSIMIWESTDLVNWSDQRMVQVAPDGAGNCWAPESIYDPITGEYIVFWSSRNRDTGNGHWIMYAKTRDFVTFTPAKVYTQNQHTGIIDSTIIYNEDDGYYYRYTKWEYSYSPLGVSANSIYVERSKTLLPPDSWEWVDDYGKMIVSGGYEGPAIFEYNEDDRDQPGQRKFGLMIDEYATGARRRFVPMYSYDLSEASFTFPTGFQMPTNLRACHGVVLPITRDEYNALAARWNEPVYQNRPQ